MYNIMHVARILHAFNMRVFITGSHYWSCKKSNVLLMKPSIHRKFTVHLILRIGHPTMDIPNGTPKNLKFLPHQISTANILEKNCRDRKYRIRLFDNC